MKWKIKGRDLLFFFSGVFVCYITLQFHYFEIKKDLDIPSLVLSIITIFIGVYIAETLQIRVNHNQNQHSYLISKIDVLWLTFNQFSEKILYGSELNAAEIRSFNKNLVYPIAFLRNIFKSFKIDENCLGALEEKLEKLETFLVALPVSNNIVNYIDYKEEIEIFLTQINGCYSDLLKSIHQLK